jgi:hypothetical protein
MAHRDINIYDISDPQMPNLLGQYSDGNLSLAGSIEMIAEQDYLYTAFDSKGFQIIDVSNPITPTKVADHNPLGFVGEIALDGTYLYALNNWEGIKIYDLNNPISPTLIGFYPTQVNTGIQVKDDYAYTINTSGFDSLEIIDVSNPVSPTLVTQHPITFTLRQLVLQDNYAYIAADNHGLAIVDIFDPNNPETVSLTELGVTVWEVAVANGYAVVGSYEPKVVIADISNPITPTVVSTYNLTDSVHALAVEDNYLYVIENGNGLHIVDISNIISPTIVGFYPLDLFANNGDIEINNGKVYASYDDQVFVLDATIPTSPTLITHYQSSNRLWDLDLYGSYVYLAHDVHGLTILAGCRKSNR